MIDKVDLKDKLVLVTGANSMIGRATIKALLDADAHVVSSSHKHCDLMDIYNLRTMYENTEIDYAILLQTYSGNVKFNRTFPADTYYRTAQMALNTLKFCQEKKVKKVVSVLSSCAYPNNGQTILKESEFWNGQPDESIESHGFSKRIFLEYSRQLSRQYNLNAVCAVVNNSYGEYDSFDIKKTKVVAALIKRFSDAKRDKISNVTLWGSGTPFRSFVYAGDVGIGLVKVLENYSDTELPINIASDKTISIRELAELVADLVGYDGDITWDMGKDGQMQKTLFTNKMEHHLDWKPATSLRKGLEKTIAWYLKNVSDIQQEKI